MKKELNDDNDTSKNHSGKERTLFVINIPIYCNEESIKNVFSCFGVVDRVYLHSKPTSNINEELKIKPSYFKPKINDINSFKVAYVVFNNTNSMLKSLQQTINEPQILSTNEKPLHTGLRSKN